MIGEILGPPAFGSRPERSSSNVSFLIAIVALHRRHLAHKIFDSSPYTSGAVAATRGDGQATPSRR